VRHNDDAAQGDIAHVTPEIATGRMVSRAAQYPKTSALKKVLLFS